MSNRKTTLFYALLIAIASLAVGMVIASRLDLSPESSAQTIAAPPFNNAPITGGITATTFRDVAKAVTPAVVNIRTESRRRNYWDLESSSAEAGLARAAKGDDLFQRFFSQGDRAPQRQRRARAQRCAGRPERAIIEAKAGFILTQQPRRRRATKIEVSLFRRRCRSGNTRRASSDATR
jgi:S1-C subfamily serine protease